MSEVHGPDGNPIFDDEVTLKLNAAMRLRAWRRRSIYAGAAFLLSCGSLSPFLSGGPLHAYWEMLGKYLVMLSMALLVVFVYCAGLWWAAWSAARDLEATR